MIRFLINELSVRCDKSRVSRHKCKQLCHKSTVMKSKMIPPMSCCCAARFSDSVVKLGVDSFVNHFRVTLKFSLFDGWWFWISNTLAFGAYETTLNGWHINHSHSFSHSQIINKLQRLRCLLFYQVLFEFSPYENRFWKNKNKSSPTIFNVHLKHTMLLIGVGVAWLDLLFLKLPSFKILSVMVGWVMEISGIRVSYQIWSSLW